MAKNVVSFLVRFKMRLYFDALTPIMLHSTLDSYAKINVLSTCVSVTVGLLASGKILTIKYVNT